MGPVIWMAKVHLEQWQLLKLFDCLGDICRELERNNGVFQALQPDLMELMSEVRERGVLAEFYEPNNRLLRHQVREQK